MSPRKTKDNPLGLDPVDGQAVTEIGIEIPGAAGGFREPLDVDTDLIDMMKNAMHGDTIFIVLQAVKKKWRYEDAKNHDGTLKRIDIYKVDGVGILDSDTALGAIDEVRERVRLAIEAAEGVQRLPLEGAENQDPDDQGGASE